MKNERNTVLTIMIEDPTTATVITNHWSEKGIKGLRTESAPLAKPLLIEGLMMRTDINTNSKRGVIIEPMPGSASSSESSGMNRRPCPNRMNPSSDDCRWWVLAKILLELGYVPILPNCLHHLGAVTLSEVPYLPY